jgi:hypothetical protein
VVLLHRGRWVLAGSGQQKGRAVTSTSNDTGSAGRLPFAKYKKRGS